MSSYILVVEDEPAIAEMLGIVLRHAGFTVRVASDAQAAQAEVNQALPCMVILDWMLPGESGVSLCRRWRISERTRYLPVIMLTARAAEDDEVQGLEIGADDYMTKPVSPKALIARVRALLRRQAPQALEDPVRVGPVELDPATHRVTADHVPHGPVELKLGPTEFRLLHFFLKHPQRVHSRAQLLDRVWGDHVFIEERTVDVHVKRLREALSAADCASMIETVRGAGYRLVGKMSVSQAA